MGQARCWARWVTRLFPGDRVLAVSCIWAPHTCVSLFHGPASDVLPSMDFRFLSQIKPHQGQQQQQ